MRKGVRGASDGAARGKAGVSFDGARSCETLMRTVGLA